MASEMDSEFRRDNDCEIVNGRDGEGARRCPVIKHGRIEHVLQVRQHRMDRPGDLDGTRRGAKCVCSSQEQLVLEMPAQPGQRIRHGGLRQADPHAGARDVLLGEDGIENHQ